MRIVVSAVLVFIAVTTQSLAQQATLKRYTAPLAGTVVLGSVEDKYSASVSNESMPEPDADAEQVKLRLIKDNILRRFPHQRANTANKKTSSVMPPVVGVNFIADSMPDIPPDNCSALSIGGKAVSVMNGTITVHDAATGAYLTRKGLKPFSTAVGLNSIVNDYRYDPKVLYDPEADRFICIMLNSTNDHNWIVLGFSASNDPVGAWNFYKFYGDYMGDTTWFDYPAIAVTKSEFFFTGNKIRYNTSWQAGFTRSLIYQVRKQNGYDGDSLLTYQIWDSVQYNNKYLRCLHPISPGDSLQGPAQYFLSNRNFDTLNDSVFLVKVPDTIGSTDTVLTVTPLVSTTQSYGVPPDARQPDTALSLATNDGRILGAYAQGNEVQFVSVSLDPAFGSSAIFHGVISNYKTTPSVTGHLFSIDTIDLGYPNISYAGSGTGANQSIISFNFSGPNTYPGFGAIMFDGAAYSDMLVIKSGDSVINRLAQKEQRWGDYSGSQPDWGRPGSVWVNGIFGRKDHGYKNTYGNYMAQLLSPYHEGVTITPSPHAVSSKLYPNPAPEFISIEFSVSSEQVFSFFIYDMQGRLVDKITDNLCQEGTNILKFNISPLPPGTYILRSKGSDGEQLAPHTFIRK